MRTLICLLLVTCLHSCFTQESHIKTGLEGSPLPSFDLLLLDSTTHINTARIQSENPIVFFYFTPDCPYCRAQTEEILDKVKPHTNIHFFMLSNTSINFLKKYVENFNLKKQKDITVAMDYTHSFANYFKISSVPFTVIYNKKKKLTQVFNGIVDFKHIKNIALGI